MKRVFAFLFVLFYICSAQAAGEAGYILQKDFTELTPVFLYGHEGDMSKINGFDYSGPITLNEVIVGTVYGYVGLWNPPLRFGNSYHQVSVWSLNIIDGYGDFEMYGQGVALGSSTTATKGDIVVAWSGSVYNGFGKLDGAFGLGSGNVLGNIFGGTANGLEFIHLRFGF